MQTITRDKVAEARTNKNATLVEVLDESHFKEFHLPGAINVPLNEQFEERIQQAVPDKDDTVIVYCQDAECPASEKAAAKMDGLGYDNVYDYTQGKMDWKQAGMPIDN